MKRFLFVAFLVVVLAAFIVPVVFAQSEQPPKIEDFDLLAQLILGLVTMAVTFGIKAIAKNFGVDLTGNATQITAAIVLTIFEFLNGLLLAVPVAWYPVVVTGLGFVTSILVASGAALVLKGKHTSPALSAKK